MLLDRVLDWLPLVVLAATLSTAKVRAWLLKRRGVRVVIVDWRRPPGELLYDTLIIAVSLCWIYLLLAEAWPLSLAWLPDWLTRKIIDALPLRLIGAAMLLTAPILFGASLRSFATSWRI